jgi:NitT/TauT family transport system substrate-binding protein
MRFKAFMSCLLTMSLCAAGAAMGEPLRVTVGITNALADVGFFIADKRGYFAEQNIKVSFVSFDAAARMIAPFASGDLDVGGGGVAAGLFNAVNRGVGMRIVADKSTSAPGLSTAALEVRKDLATAGLYRGPSDLKGRKIAVPAPGTGTSTSLNQFFTRHGFGLRDVDLAYMSFPQMVQALQNKAVDGAFLTEPGLTKALTDGAAELVAADDQMFPNHQIAVTLFSERFIKTDRKVAVGFMKAMLKGARDYNDAVKDGRLAGSGAEDIIAILTEYSAIKDPAVYRAIRVHSCDPDGGINLDSLAVDLAFFRAEGLIEGPVTLASAIDASLAQEALRELGPYRHK